MSAKAMSLKGKISNYAKQQNIAAQVVLQNYMFERFLERLSLSEYRDKFVIKGGMLIAAIVGLDTRSTMDLDTTLKGLPLNEDRIVSVIKSVCGIKTGDDVEFKYISIAPIRKDDIYGGFCVRIDAVYDTIVTPLSIDISTGDIITPAAVEYEFSGIFDDNVKIRLWGYNIETVLAEKIETILRRSVFNTRPRDYYDAYIIGTTQKYDDRIFKDALIATAEHRGSVGVLERADDILEQISESGDLKASWEKYQKKFSYARDIRYDTVIAVITNLISGIKK